MRQALGKYWAGITAGLMAIQLAVLAAMGQPWVCACGVKLWTGAGITGESSKHVADWYTFSHILHGILFYLLLWLVAKKVKLLGTVEVRFLAAVAMEVAWEIFENTPFVINHYRSNTAAVDYRGDTILNSGFDTLWMALGFALALKLPVKWVVALLVVFEVGAALAVRDNLTLNILTFIWPVQAIVDWQGAA